jgi:Replication-relaxation
MKIPANPHTKPYRPRRIRSGNPPAFQLTMRDMEIVRLVAKYRFLKSDHIRRLVQGSAKNITNRLKALFEHGLLDRPQNQFDTYRMGGGTSPLVYALADRGSQLLADTYEQVGGKRISWTHKNKFVTRPFLQHTLGIADFSVVMQIAVAGRDEVDLIDSDELMDDFPAENLARNKPYRLSVPVIHQSLRLDIGIEPDYAFSLYLPNVRRKAFFLVEIDRGTMPVARRDLKQSSILRKLLAYQTMWKMRLHQKHFGWGNFRVLFVTESKERVENMIAAANSQSQTSHSPLFLLADKHGLYDLDDALDYQWWNTASQLQYLLPKPANPDTDI